jgi:hypothetical protein
MCLARRHGLNCETLQAELPTLKACAPSFNAFGKTLESKLVMTMPDDLQPFNPPK